METYEIIAIALTCIHRCSSLHWVVRQSVILEIEKDEYI